VKKEGEGRDEEVEKDGREEGGGDEEEEYREEVNYKYKRRFSILNLTSTSSPCSGLQ